MEVSKSMEARPGRVALWAAVLFVSMGARYRTPNFVIDTPDPKLAQQLGAAAEKYRRTLAVEWLGKEMPKWSQPCVTTVRIGPRLGAGGETTFVFDRGEVYGWRMIIQGPRQRLFDSVLPHEILHTLFASHFRRPVPRWADEGAASSVEHASERNRHRRKLYQFLRTGHGIPISRMFAMKQYPRDMMPLYAQGHSLATFLIQRGGKREFVALLGDGMQTGDWSGAIKRRYGVAGMGALQNVWLAWVKQGSPLTPRAAPPAASPSTQVLASNDRRRRPAPNLIHRVPKQAVSYAPGSVIPAKTTELGRSDRAPRPKELPSSGWYAAGSRPTASLPVTTAVPTSPPPVRSQVTRPQPYQYPQPRILQWGGG